MDTTLGSERPQGEYKILPASSGEDKNLWRKDFFSDKWSSHGAMFN
jgi:hypothetical protein